jgi:hypothetical protein
MEYVSGTPFPDMFERSTGYKIFQGDIIRRVEDECDFFDGQEGAVGYLIISNSCDIINEDIEYISLVPVYPFFKAIRVYMDKYRDKFEKIDGNEKHYNKNSKIKDFENQIASIIEKETNYNGKSTFFISPLNEFSSLPTLALIEDVRSTLINDSKEILLMNRLCSLKNPWREKLGFKAANLYNRIATYTPNKDEISTWWKIAYEKDYKEIVDILPE